MTCGARMFLLGWNWQYSPRRLRLGETVRAEIAETFVQLPAVVRTGVCPRGAHVRAIVGTSKNPLSSRKPKWAPSSTVFF